MALRGAVAHLIVEEFAKLLDDFWDDDLHEVPVALPLARRGAAEEIVEPGSNVVPDVFLLSLYLNASVTRPRELLEDFIENNTLVLLLKVAVVRDSVTSHEIKCRPEFTLNDERLDVDAVVFKGRLDIVWSRGHGFPDSLNVEGFHDVGRIVAHQFSLRLERL